MEIFLIRLLQFMLAISLLIILHEGGHFFFSKLFGVRVEKFYLFFDPWFHLFEFKPKNSETRFLKTLRNRVSPFTCLSCKENNFYIKQQKMNRC